MTTSTRPPPSAPATQTSAADPVLEGEGRTLRVSDRLFVIFGVLLALAWIGPALATPSAWSFVLRNLGVVALYLVLMRIRIPSLGAAAWLRMGLVSVVMPFNYFQTGALIKALHPSYVADIEAFLLQSDLTLFGAGFHGWLHDLRQPVATEILQLCYASFFFLPLLLLLILTARRKIRSVPEAFLGVVFALLVSYVGYLIVPARSPGFVHAELAPDGGIWVAGDLWIYLRELGDGAHDAFPSGHTAVSLLLIYYAARFDRVALLIIGPIAAALVVSTVYMQYHYVVDVLAGALLTVLAAFFARRVAVRGAKGVAVALLVPVALCTTTGCRQAHAPRDPLAPPSAARVDGYAAAPRPLSEPGWADARSWCTEADPPVGRYAPVSWTWTQGTVTGPLARLAPGSVAPLALGDADGAWARRAAEFTTPPPGDAGPPLPSVCDPEAWQRAVCLSRARRKSTWLAAAGVGAILTYGLLFWDYGSNPFHFKDDGLLEENTVYGGADKTGHTVAASIHTAVFSAINRSFGIPRKEAALRGSLTAFAVLAMVEVGDGFTKVHGFNYGDLVGDALGCLFGYFHESSPWFARTFDLRWEYWPTDQVWSGEDLDLSTDYEGSSYLLAVNVGSVVGRPQSLWNLLDFQVGYNTRHYVDLAGDPERNVLLGVGINFSNLFRRIGWSVPAKICEYYQIPYTSLRVSIDLND